MTAMKSIHLLFLISTTSVFGQHSPESLMTDFSSGKLFIVNELAVADADTSFFTKLASLNILNYESLAPNKGKENYGTIGERGAIKINVSNSEALREEYAGLLESYVLKHFNQEDSLFYHIDGIPNHDIYYALNSLIGKKIDEIKVLGKNQASALWGERDGKNGAILISCNREEKLTFD